MKVTDDHWLDTAKRDPIEGGAAMVTRRFLVHHFTAGASASSSIDSMREQGLSAHLVIDRDGTIYQCRPFNRTCGHAGASKWKDPKSGIQYSNLNSCSIGIEIANGGDSFPTRFSNLPPITARHKNGGPVKQWEQYTPKQIEVITQISKVLVARYNLDDLVGHDDIAPDRKNDPGPAWPLQSIREACGFEGLPKR